MKRRDYRLFIQDIYETVWRVVQEELPTAEPLLREALDREQEANA